MISPHPRLHEAFRAALLEHGWAEGSSVEIVRASSTETALAEAVAMLRVRKVELIAASGTTAIRAARDGAPDIPIVMINAGDPVGAGFVQSLSRPGGRLTGTSAAGEEVLTKQLELLHEAAPRSQRVGWLMNAANPANDFFHRVLAERARQLALQAVRIEVAKPSEIGPALGASGVQSLIVLGDPMFNSRAAHIADTALRLRLPTMFGARDLVAAGGLMHYNSSYEWHFRAAAGFVDKILRGARPSDLPVQQPTEFELTINLQTARALGIALPQALLLRATEVLPAVRP
ncbi:MAG: ABC transporter substrate-binding protein [Burkholderiaceae bacterium]|nr:ABC transporter substrate-binding protein [Burkholderiaceae bacterium]